MLAAQILMLSAWLNATKQMSTMATDDWIFVPFIRAKIILCWINSPKGFMILYICGFTISYMRFTIRFRAQMWCLRRIAKVSSKSWNWCNTRLYGNTCVFHYMYCPPDFMFCCFIKWCVWFIVCQVVIHVSLHLLWVGDTIWCCGSGWGNDGMSPGHVLAWISNHMPDKVWDEITYPFPNFNEVWEWISNFTHNL